MRFLNLDQSTKISGFSVFDNTNLIDYGHVDSSIKKNLPLERMKKTSELIAGLIDKYKPDFVVLENVQFQQSYATYNQLSQLQGVLFKLLFDKKIPFTTVAPVTWKKFCGITGKRRAEQKENTIKMVKEKFKIDTTEDEADAIGIGLWSVNNIDMEAN
jgi:Holliday junction resolvasome RuvABC endonuclease subunit